MIDFEKQRETFTWGSFGRKHDEPLKLTKLKDISDSHLLHLIPWVECRQFDDDILHLLKSEMRYRMENYIFVPEYN